MSVCVCVCVCACVHENKCEKECMHKHVVSQGGRALLCEMSSQY